MTKRVPLERLRDMTKQRSIRRPYLPRPAESETESSPDGEEAGTEGR